MPKPQRKLKQTAFMNFQTETNDYALTFYRQLKSYILQIQSQVQTLPFFVQAPAWQDPEQRDLRQELSYWSSNLELIDQALNFLAQLNPEHDLDVLCRSLHQHLQQLYQAQALSFEFSFLHFKLQTQATELKQLRTSLNQNKESPASEEWLQSAYLQCYQLADELDILERQGINLQDLETLYIDLIIELGEIQTEANVSQVTAA